MFRDMTSQMYSLEQIAERLGLHVRTVRAYVRSGRLKAVRIGKQYRVMREDLEAITGPIPEAEAIPRHRHVEVSSFVLIDAVSEDSAARVIKHLMDAAKTPRGGGSPLRIETVYDEHRARMKINVMGSLPAAADVFRLLGVILETT